MEEIKQFKCMECDAKFVSLEQLQKHNRRHEMSINLPTKSSLAGGSQSLSTPSVNKGSLSAGVIGFVDETPTPTRFIRNCEEVGLFQDLQNVNPFDEDFKKAASTATPSGEATGFEFTFSSSVIGVPGTPNNECGQNIRNSKSKRRYSEQDTLNTPQVFPYFTSTGGCSTLTTNTASMSACLTPTPQNSVTNENLNNELHQTPPAETSNNHISTTSYNHEEHVSIIAYTSAISQQTNNNKNDGGCTPKLKGTETPKTGDILNKNSDNRQSIPNGQQGKLSSLKIRSKTNLKLDLKTVILKEKFSSLSEKVTKVRIAEPLQRLHPTDVPESEFSGKNSELLERNRAAAHRSRERRKQWVYGLESRCRALETLLAQSQAEVVRLRTENEKLKAQLQSPARDETSHLHEESTSNKSVEESDDSIMIHQTIHKEAEKGVIREPLADTDIGTSSSDIVIVSPIVLPTVKAKRGRPRKGEERRVPIFAVPMISTDETKSLPKIPILPMSQAIKKS